MNTGYNLNDCGLRALLIQKSIKQLHKDMCGVCPFESFVNSGRVSNNNLVCCHLRQLFESFVNSEEYQTTSIRNCQDRCLRAVLIQKRSNLHVPVLSSLAWFESFVNLRRVSNLMWSEKLSALFESFVNSEEHQNDSSKKLSS